MAAATERPGEAASYEILEHTADVGIRARGATAGEVFEQATLALAELLGALVPVGEAAGSGQATVPAHGAVPDQAAAAGPETVAIGVEAADLGGLLVDWLGEVLYLHEVRDAAVAAVHVEHLVDHLTARGTGHGPGGPPASAHGPGGPPGGDHTARGTVTLRPVTGGEFEGTPVKAVTYHRLRVEQEPEGGGWVAEVYLDV